MREFLRRRFHWLVIPAFLVLTNAWFGLESSTAKMQAEDVKSYLRIAESAPGFPAPGTVEQQHAQRFVLHWSMGLASRLTHLPLEWLYRLLQAIVLLALVMRLRALARAMGLRSDRQHWFFVALFFWNPYAVRYYLAVPGMVGDQLFSLLLIECAIAMQTNSLPRAVGGLVFATLFRQTAIVVSPGVAIRWWRNPMRAAVLILAPLAVYIALKQAAIPFSMPKVNMQGLTGAFEYLLSGKVDLLLALGEHTLRIMIPHLFALALFVASVREARRDVLWRLAPFGLAFFLMTFQPWVIRPDFASRNETRLSALALPMLLVLSTQAPMLWAWIERNIIGLSLLMCFGSLHYMTAWVSPWKTAAQFAGAHIAAAALFFAASLKGTKSSVSPDRPV